MMIFYFEKEKTNAVMFILGNVNMTFYLAKAITIKQILKIRLNPLKKFLFDIVKI